MKHSYNIIKSVFTITLLSVLITACNEDIPSFVEETEPPVVTAIFPESGYVSDEVSIEGQNLQMIDSVWIGGGLAKIKYKLSNEKMIVSVSNESKTGVIKIKGKNGEAQSSGNFTYLYATPDIQHSPVEGEIGYEVEITGDFVDYVSKVLIGVNRKEAPIVYQSRRDMRVIVPVETDLTEVPIVYVYEDETGEKEISSPTEFKIIAKIPIVSNGSLITATTTGRTVTLIGVNMKNIQKVFIEIDENTRLYARIFAANSSSTSFSFEPRQMEELSNIAGKIRYQYYGTEEETINDNFELSQVDSANASYFWEDVTLTYRDIRKYASFFSCDSGSLFFGVDLVQKNTNGSFVNSLGLENQRSTDMLFYVNSSGSGYLYGPHNTIGILKNFQYVDPMGFDTKAAQYGFGNPELEVIVNNKSAVFENTVYYKVLAPAIPEQTGLIEKVLNGEITENTVIDDALFAGITVPTKGSVSTTTDLLSENSVVWFKRKADGKNGLIRVKKFSDPFPLNSSSHVIFDVHFQK